MSLKENLNKIINYYKDVKFDVDIFYSHSGRSINNSIRYRAALQDKGKLTLQKTISLFEKATAENKKTIEYIILFAVPNPEWHHSNFKYKRKTYFINSKEIVNIATNFNLYKKKILEKPKVSKVVINNENKMKLLVYEKAKRFFRVILKQIPKNYYIEKQEMKGKYGFFDINIKYNLPVYYTGFYFENEKDRKKYDELHKNVFILKMKKIEKNI